jgi:hypothetical protein
MSIAYAAGNQYCILSIPKSKARQCGIDNPNEVEIQETRQGILIKKKNAGVSSTSQEFAIYSSTTTSEVIPINGP